MNSYYQFLLAIIIVGYFLANILDGWSQMMMGQESIPGLDYILFGILVVLVIINRKNISKFLERK